VKWINKKRKDGEGCEENRKGVEIEGEGK